MASQFVTLPPITLPPLSSSSTWNSYPRQTLPFEPLRAFPQRNSNNTTFEALPRFEFFQNGIQATEQKENHQQIKKKAKQDESQDGELEHDEQKAAMSLMMIFSENKTNNSNNACDSGREKSDEEDYSIKQSLSEQRLEESLPSLLALIKQPLDRIQPERKTTVLPLALPNWISRKENPTPSTLAQPALKSSKLITEPIIDDSFDSDSSAGSQNEETRDRSKRSRFNDELWLKHYNELKRFKTNFGHCNVTQSCKEYKNLANWVHNQRKNQGRTLPKHRREKLLRLGFEFDRSYAAVAQNCGKKRKSEDEEEKKAVEFTTFKSSN